MPNAITPDERALIDAALATGKVKRCKPCTYTGHDPKVGRHLSAGKNVPERRAQVRRLALIEKLTITQIAARMGISVEVVRRDLSVKMRG